MDYHKLSKVISHALRHAPSNYLLELQDEGWVNLDLFVKAIRRANQDFESITIDDLEAVVKVSEKKRIEISMGRIGAQYGHSVKSNLLYQPKEPPNVLFHGTCEKSIERIKSEGILPMKRQYVHLSQDIAQATHIAKRRNCRTVVLQVDAQCAYNLGVEFFCIDNVWLCKNILPAYIKMDLL